MDDMSEADEPEQLQIPGTEERPERVEPSSVGLLEAVLFAAGNPMSIADLASILQIGELGTYNLITELQEDLRQRRSGLTVRKVAGGYQLATRPEAYPIVDRLSQVVDRRLSAPTMETLAIVAFKQPITKHEIENIRGVRVEKALAKLVELDLVNEVGRKHVLGRPILYGTTSTFLRVFGLNTLEDLPEMPTTAEAAAALTPEQLELLHEVQATEAAQTAADAAAAADEGTGRANEKPEA